MVSFDWFHIICAAEWLSIHLNHISWTVFIPQVISTQHSGKGQWVFQKWASFKGLQQRPPESLTVPPFLPTLVLRSLPNATPLHRAQGLARPPRPLPLPRPPEPQRAGAPVVPCPPTVAHMNDGTSGARRLHVLRRGHAASAKMRKRGVRGCAKGPSPAFQSLLAPKLWVWGWGGGGALCSASLVLLPLDMWQRGAGLVRLGLCGWMDVRGWSTRSGGRLGRAGLNTQTLADDAEWSLPHHRPSTADTGNLL